MQIILSMPKSETLVQMILFMPKSEPLVQIILSTPKSEAIKSSQILARLYRHQGLQAWTHQPFSQNIHWLPIISRIQYNCVVQFFQWNITSRLPWTLDCLHTTLLISDTKTLQWPVSETKHSGQQASFFLFSFFTDPKQWKTGTHYHMTFITHLPHLLSSKP